MVDTVDGGIRFNVDAGGTVVPANPDSAVEATEAFMAQNASRGPAARKRKAERDASSGGEDESTNASTSKETTTTTTKKKKNKKKRASKKTVAAAAAAAVAARGTTGTAASKTGVTVTTTTKVRITAKPAAATTDSTDAKPSAETSMEKEDSPNAPAALAQPSALAAAVAPGPAPTALVAATSTGSIPNNAGGVIAPPAPALTAQVSLDAEQLLRRQMQEYQQLQRFSSPPGQMVAHQGQESALAQADRMILASLLEQEQQRQLLAAQLSGQYHPQHLQQQALTNRPTASPALAAASAPAGAAAAPSAASLLRQQQQQDAAASLGLSLPDPAATAATAASASSSPGATANAAARAEYLVYLETLDRMSASINAAQNLEAAYRTNPTVVGRLQYLAANDEMAAVMHRAKIQAMNLQRIRLESRLNDLNASLGTVMQGGAPAPALAAAAAAGTGVVPDAGAGAMQLSPNSLLRQVSD